MKFVFVYRNIFLLFFLDLFFFMDMRKRKPVICVCLSFCLSNQEDTLLNSCYLNFIPILFCFVLIGSILLLRRPGSSVGIVTDYGLDGPGSNPDGDEIFCPSRPALGANPASRTMSTRSFPGVKCNRVVMLTTHPFLVLWSWKSRAIPQPNLWATPGL